MTDIDKNKVDRARYFSCLSMMLLELSELSNSFVVMGSSINKIMQKYSVLLYADKKRCRVALQIPEHLNNPELIKSIHKQLLIRSKQYFKSIKTNGGK